MTKCPFCNELSLKVHKWTVTLMMETCCVPVVNHCLLVNNLFFGIWTKYLPHTDPILTQVHSNGPFPTNTHIHTELWPNAGDFHCHCCQMFLTPSKEDLRLELLSHTHRVLREGNKRSSTSMKISPASKSHSADPTEMNVARRGIQGDSSPRKFSSI